jgi:hypothetical protein
MAADFYFPGSQSLSSSDITTLLQGIFKGSDPSYAAAYAADMTQIGGAEGGGQTGIVVNTAFPNLPNYETPQQMFGAGAGPEYSIGLFGEDIYIPGNYNLVASVLGQQGLPAGQAPTAAEAESLGRQFAASPSAQALVTYRMYQGAGNTFAPWTDPTARRIDASGTPGALPAGETVSAAAPNISTTGYTSSTTVTSGASSSATDVSATDTGTQVQIPDIFSGGGLLGGIAGVGKFFGGLAQGSLWLRMGEVLLGVVILAGSVVLFVAVLAAENKALSAVAAVAGLGKFVGIGKKADAGLASAGSAMGASRSAAGASSPSPDESFSKWWREGNRRTRRVFETGDTRESAGLEEFYREQSRHNREVARRNRPRSVAADEGSY